MKENSANLKEKKVTFCDLKYFPDIDIMNIIELYAYFVRIEIDNPDLTIHPTQLYGAWTQERVQVWLMRVLRESVGCFKYPSYKQRRCA